MDGIKVTCQCGRILTAPASHAGKKGRCPTCGFHFIIPAPMPSAPPAARSRKSRAGIILGAIIGILILAGVVMIIASSAGKPGTSERDVAVKPEQPAPKPDAPQPGAQPAPAPEPAPEPAPTPELTPAPEAKLPDAPEGFKAVEAEGRDKDTGLWKEIEHVKSGIRLRLIPAGEFYMGESMSAEDTLEKYGGTVEWYKPEHPRHHVKISKPFYMGKYEVTQTQWKVIMGNNPSNWKGDNLPVEQVSWNDVQGFLNKAGDGLRLPSEAEWEYACRAGSKGQWCFGDNENILGDYAWYNKNSDNQTHPVGQKKPNGWGLYDMHGNVWEWCSDWYGEKYYEECRNGVIDPSGPGNGAGRVLRGGELVDVAWVARSATRDGDRPDLRGGDGGFRVVVSARDGS